MNSWAEQPPTIQVLIAARLIGGVAAGMAYPILFVATIVVYELDIQTAFLSRIATISEHSI